MDKPSGRERSARIVLIRPPASWTTEQSRPSNACNDMPLPLERKRRAPGKYLLAGCAIQEPMALIETDEGQPGQAWPKPPARGHAQSQGHLCNDGAADLSASVIDETWSNRDRRAVFNGPACTGSRDCGATSQTALEIERIQGNNVQVASKVVAMTGGYEHIDRADPQRPLASHDLPYFQLHLTSGLLGLNDEGRFACSLGAEAFRP